MARVVSWRKLRFRFDWMLTVATLVCISLGLLNLWSAVRERQFHLFAQQISWAAVGGLLFLAVASFDYRVIARMGYVLYGVGIALLVTVLIHGKMVGGSRRWFDLGAFHLQPSELMKVLTIIALAKYVHETPALDGRTLRHILVPIFLAGLPFLLIAAQPDLGTALIVVLIFATVMLTARLRLKTWPASPSSWPWPPRPCGNTPCTTISATASWPSSTRRWIRPPRGNHAKP